MTANAFALRRQRDLVRFFRDIFGRGWAKSLQARRGFRAFHTPRCLTSAYPSLKGLEGIERIASELGYNLEGSARHPVERNFSAKFITIVNSMKMVGPGSLCDISAQCAIETLQHKSRGRPTWSDVLLVEIVDGLPPGTRITHPIPIPTAGPMPTSIVNVFRSISSFKQAPCQLAVTPTGGQADPPPSLDHSGAEKETVREPGIKLEPVPVNECKRIVQSIACDHHLSLATRTHTLARIARFVEGQLEAFELSESLADGEPI